MGRPKNQLESAELTIQTNPILKEHLEELVLTGRYGKNANEAAERLVAQEIGRLIDLGKLKERRGKAKGE